MVEQTILPYSSEETTQLLSKTPTSAPSHSSWSQILPTLSYAIMLCSAIFQALMTFCVHVSETRHGFRPLAALFIRGSVSLTFSTALLALSKRLHVLRLTGQAYIYVVALGFAGSLSIFFSFQALARLPVGTAVTIMYTSPIITSVLAALLLSEPFTSTSLGTLLLNFAGVYLVSQASGQHGEEAVSLAGIFFALLSATTISFVYILARSLGRMGVHFLVCVLATGASILCVSVCGILLSTGGLKGGMVAVDEAVLNRPGLAFASASAVCGFLAQACFHLGIQHILTGPATIMRSMSVPVSFMLGLVFLGERPSTTNGLGIAMVLTSIVIIGVRKWNEERG